MSVEKMEKISGGKFWGKKVASCKAVENGAGQVLYYYECSSYYVFWIDTTKNENCVAVSSCAQS